MAFGVKAQYVTAAWIIVGGTFLYTMILPILPIALIMRRKKIDFNITERKERTTPYFVAIISYGFWVMFLLQVKIVPHYLIAIAFGSALSILIIMLVNFRWKISAHLSGMGGLTGAVVGVSYAVGINPVGLIISVLLFSGLTALARLELNAHTPAQVIAGYSVGFLSVFLPVFIV